MMALLAAAWFGALVGFFTCACLTAGKLEDRK